MEMGQWVMGQLSDGSFGSWVMGHARWPISISGSYTGVAKLNILHWLNKIKQQSVYYVFANAAWQARVLMLFCTILNFKFSCKQMNNVSVKSVIFTSPIQQ